MDSKLKKKWVARIQAYFASGSVCVSFWKEQERARTAMTDFCEYSKCTEQNELLLSVSRRAEQRICLNDQLDFMLKLKESKHKHCMDEFQCFA